MAVASITVGLGLVVATGGTVIGGLLRLVAVAVLGAATVLLARGARPIMGATLLALVGGAATVAGEWEQRVAGFLDAALTPPPSPDR